MNEFMEQLGPKPKPTIEELEEILDGKHVDIEILPSGEIVERMAVDNRANSWPEQDAVCGWIEKYHPKTINIESDWIQILELCTAVSKYRIQEQARAKKEIAYWRDSFEKLAAKNLEEE